MKTAIFYGAGRVAADNLVRWEQSGLSPVCFADADPSKWHTIFRNGDLATGIEILPLDTAVKLYPDREIYVTVAPVNYETVADYLVLHGIARDAIKYPLCETDGLPKYCDTLGRYMVLTAYETGRLSIQTCCYMGASAFQSSGSFASDYQKWRKLTMKMTDDLAAGLSNTCIGCPQLKNGVSPDIPKLQRINVSTGIPGGERCNLDCCYCTYRSMLRQPGKMDTENGYSVLNALKWCAENTGLHTVEYAAGEITVSPYCGEILEIWRKAKWQGTIYTNCVIHNCGIAGLLREGNCNVNCSLDAGTAETFKSIKGVDCFEKVIANLEKYAASREGAIQLKYVFMQGVNDSKTDINGFCDIAKRISAEVILSRDSNNYAVCLSDREREHMQMLAEMCKDSKLRVTFDDSRVRTDELATVRRLL